MPGFLIVAFVYFIILDILIFLRMWNFVIVGVIFGAVLIIVGLLLRAFVPAAKGGTPETASVNTSITRDTPVMQTDTGSGTYSLGVTLFVIETVVIMGLLVYLFIK